MRATFSIELTSTTEKDSPSDDEVLKFLQTLGFNDRASTSQANIIQAFNDKAGALMKNCPNVWKKSKAHVIYFGMIASYQVGFVVFRSTSSDLQFELIHNDPTQLTDATTRLISKLLILDLEKLTFSIEIIKNSILIFEDDGQHSIGRGSIIQSKLKETFHHSLKDIIFLILTASIWLIFLFLQHIQLIVQNPQWEDRIPFIFGTTASVSIISIIMSYLSLNTKGLISWHFLLKDRPMRQ